MKNDENRIIQGYKAFVKDGDTLYDRFGTEYHEGDLLHVSGNIRFHNKGFHFCSHPEDTLRYVNAFDDDVVVAKVIGFGKVSEYQDEYYDYGGMFATSDLKILKVYSREELMEHELNYSYNLPRFIEGYNLTLEELCRILEASNNSKDTRFASLLHVVMHKALSFKKFIDMIDITDDERAFVSNFIELSNLGDDTKEIVRTSLGTEIKKDKTRVRE